jgi:GAF domain-containing protein
VGETRDLARVYSTIYEHIRAMVDAWSFVVSFYNENNHLIEAGYAVHKGIAVDVTGMPPIPLGEPGHGTQSQVIHSGEPLYVADYRQALETSKAEYIVEADGTVTEGSPGMEEEEVTRSSLYAPMKIEGKTIGVMQLQSPHLDAYNAEDMNLLTAMASVAAVAIENARLYEALQRELAERMQAEEALKEHSERLEDVVEQRTAELRKLVNAMAGREVRMAELKQAIRRLRAQLTEAGLEPVADDPLLEGDS